jgi:hypothetical protein
MIGLFHFVLAVSASPFESKLRLQAENASLRHQLIVLRVRDRVRLTNNDRWFFIQCIAGFHQSCWFSQSSGPRHSCVGTVDHIIILGEAHLRRILRSYACYYNGIRTHRSLGKDAAISRPVQRAGSLKTFPILGGLHHHYFRV